MVEVHEGLEGVLVGRTALSDVDGERGRLVVAGADVEALAGRISFEAVAARLWHGPEAPQSAAADVRAAIARGRVLAHERLADLAPALRLPEPMDALRGAVALLPADPFEAPALLTGAVATVAAALARRATNGAPVAPDPEAAHAADFLKMATGEVPAAARAAALDQYLVTIVDHGMNASTFAARVVASTGSDLVSAVTAAIGALKGPLHGGAPGPVLDMLDAIGDPARALGWLEGELAAGRRIMGMGHRIYRVRDPRAAVLERAAQGLEAAGLGGRRLALARAVEAAAHGVLSARHPARSLHANVEFYTAVLLEAVGLPRGLFSPTFAVGRVAGWCAHVAEQRRTGRLIRPAALYVGPPA